MIAALAIATGIAPHQLLVEDPEMLATISEILARRR